MDKAIYSQMSLYEDKHWWFAGRRRIIAFVLDRFFNKNAANTILDMGCGTGGNLDLLSQYGTLVGVELDDEAIDDAVRRNVCRVVKGSLPDDIPLDGRFDLISMLDVLEHVEEDARSLVSLASRLTDNGMLLITVPAYMFLWSVHDELHHHKRRYTRKQLEQVVSHAGLKVSYSTYFNTLLFPIAYMMRLLNKIADGGRSLGVSMPLPVVNRLLLGVFQLEIPILKMTTLPFGVSILVIAQKTSGR